MAHISLGPIVDGIRGSIHGVTFSRAHSANTARGRPRPPRPLGINQLPCQNLMSRAASNWTNLDPTYKLNWATYAATITLYDSLSTSYHPTGMNCFIWNWIYRVNAGITSTPTDRPGGDGLAAVPTLTLDYDSTNLRIASTSPALPAGTIILLYTYMADVTRAHSRKPLFIKHAASDLDSYPLIIATAYSTGLVSGNTYRAWVYWRTSDILLRSSIVQKQFLDFVV